MKPLTRPLLKLLWQYLRTPDDKQATAKVESFAIERLLRRPVLFRDQYDLEYLLYPDQSPGIYFRYNGNYEVDETKFCLNYVRPKMTVLDVGANIGLYTLLFAKLVTESGRVHAFEAESRNFSRLSQNVALNKLTQVKPSNLAVFSNPQMIELNIYDERLAAWHTIGHPQLPDPFSRGAFAEPIRKERVQAICLDDYCREENISEINLLKVDVEGAELDVLFGCKALLEDDKIHCVLFEASKPQIEGMDRSVDEIFDYLIQFGYRIFSIKDGFLGAEISSSDARYENFIALKDGDIIDGLMYQGKEER